jgi:hypothetical protein
MPKEYTLSGFVLVGSAALQKRWFENLVMQ